MDRSEADDDLHSINSMTSYPDMRFCILFTFFISATLKMGEKLDFPQTLLYHETLTSISSMLLVGEKCFCLFCKNVYKILRRIMGWEFLF